MSIASEITRLQNAKAALKSSIEAKGVTVPQDAKIDTYAELIDSIPTGSKEYEPICFASLEDGNTFKLNKEISISVDGKKTWQTLKADTNSPVINTGEKIYFRATENASPFAGTTDDYYQFTTAKTCNVSGHPYSLYAKFSSYFFGNLFNGTKVVDASDLTLDADIVSNGCYFSMFEGCTSLTTAPELPATTLANSCYNAMFRNCTSLVTAPELPATTLADSCYRQMFRGCTSLVTAPELPATTLANYCYFSMFEGCTSLTTAPELPATTLADGCYFSMFYGCTSLTTAPELPATTLTSDCYSHMFDNCTKLNYIKCLATDISASTCLSNWVTNVASTGTFVKNPNMSSWPTGTSGIPTGWTVEDAQEYQYLTFIPVVDATFKWSQPKATGHLEYSTDGGQTWVTIVDRGSTPTIKAGSKVLWRGDLVPSSLSGWEGTGAFSATGNYNAYGNTMSLLFYDNYYGKQLNSTEYNYAFLRLFMDDTHILSAPLLPATSLSYRCYRQMFRGCTSLVTAPELPSTTLANSCYESMFYSCTSLTTAPELPATTLADGCYFSMFYGCTSLTTAPELPATTLAYGCYFSMFSGCTSLTTAPELPATTLADSCYVSMFSGCTSLTTAPELPATTLADGCYFSMFYGCTKLNYIKCLATDISATNCTRSWLLYVASTGTFVKAAEMEDWLVGDDGRPSGWTVVNDNA